MKTKKILCVVLALSILLSLSVTYADNLENMIKVNLGSIRKIVFNGKDLTAFKNRVFVVQDNTYVPLRELLEAMGNTVDWNQAEKSIMITSSKTVDAKASASVTNYYEGSSLKGADLMNAIAERKCAISVATVNADGTPNAAVVIPGVADTDTLMFGLADNQTKVNIIERKQAVITAYIYNPTAADKLERNKGAKIMVEHISNEATIKELMEKTKAREGTMFVKITKILPLG